MALLLSPPLKEIAERFPENVSKDDVTVLLARANGTELRHSLKEQFWAMMRFMGSLVRAVNPKAERSSLPDANLVNFGGAIIPALGRRWRSPDASQRSFSTQ